MSLLLLISLGPPGKSYPRSLSVVLNTLYRIDLKDVICSTISSACWVLCCYFCWKEPLMQAGAGYPWAVGRKCCSYPEEGSSCSVWNCTSGILMCASWGRVAASYRSSWCQPLTLPFLHVASLSWVATQHSSCLSQNHRLCVWKQLFTIAASLIWHTYPPFLHFLLQRPFYMADGLDTFIFSSLPVLILAQFGPVTSQTLGKCSCCHSAWYVYILRLS